MAGIDKQNQVQEPATIVNGIPAETQREQSSPAPMALSFNSSRLRIQVTLTAEYCQAHATPPEDLVGRARAKMKVIVENGAAAFFVIYQKRLEKVWQQLRTIANEGATPPASVTVTLAAGFPRLKGLVITPSSQEDAIGQITITATPSEVATWRLEWLVEHFMRVIRKAGIEGRPNTTQIHGALLRAQAGVPVRDHSIAAGKDFLKERDNNEAFHLFMNQRRQEVSIVIFDLSAIADVEAVTKRIEKIEEAITKNKNRKASFRVLREELIEAFERANSGPETLGIGLPLVLLAAIGGANAKARSAPKMRPVKGPLNLEISNDQLRATLGPCPFDVYARINVAHRKEWLEKHLAAAGISYGVRPELLENVLMKMEINEDLTGSVIAEGMAASVGQEPYLHVLGTKDGDEQSENNIQVDMRAYRAKSLVKAGQLVAEVRYAKPPQRGRTVFGAEIAPPPAPALDVKLGDGVSMGDDGRFYAASDGLIEAGEGNSLCLKELLLHEGDVNMATGDIVFGGPVEITGDIDSGVKIDIKGDLIVRGQIRGGTVRCGGNVQVVGGIIVGQKGEIRAKGDITADFVENSTVVCGGSLMVAKSILQCRVTAGTGIEVKNPSGVIASGTYTAGKALTVSNLGLPDGAKTIVEIGTSFKTEMAILTRKGRLERLRETYMQERNLLRDLTRRRPAQLTRSDVQQKEALKNRLPKWNSLIDRATAHLQAAETSLVYDQDACIRVTGRLSTTTSIKIAGRPIPITKEIRSVEITTQEQDGSYIHKRAGS